MRKLKKKAKDELRKEYDFSKLKPAPRNRCPGLESALLKGVFGVQAGRGPY